jgi:hypothetical protein
MADAAKIQELKARGFTQQGVALKLGCSERTVRNHWHPASVTPSATVAPAVVSFHTHPAERLTTLLGFEGIADDVVAGPSSEWLAWDGELRPVVPGMTGKEWKREQRALQRQSLAKLAEPAELPIAVPANEPEAATGNRQSNGELPVIAANDLLYAPRVTMSSEYEARRRLVRTFETSSPVRSRDLSMPVEHNWKPLIWLVALLLIACLFATHHYKPAQAPPLRGQFMPEVSVRR